MSEILVRVRRTFEEYNSSPFANYQPFTPNTERMLRELASLKPQTLATMHGSTFTGDSGQALIKLISAMRETLGKPVTHPSMC